jgi:Prenyltransferase and squalene oxidase repeat
MPSNAPIIRKVERTTIADFDEQWWPINALLVLLAGVVGAVIVATSDFHTQDIFRNGIIRLGVLAAIVVGLSLSSLLLRGRLQRRMQLAVLFSLVLHLWLCLGSYYTYLGMTARDEAEIARANDRERLIRQPEHTWQDSEHAESADLLERPIETETPDANQPQVERTQAAAAKAEKPSLDEPAANQPQLPSPAELERAKVTAPRRSEDLSGPQISRHELAEQPRVESPAEVPQIQRQAEQQPRSDAAPTPLERQAEAAPLERRATPDEPVAQSDLKPRPVETQRRAAEPAPDPALSETRLAALDRPRRALTDVPPLPRAQVAAPRAAENAAATRPTGVAAAATELARRDTASTAAMQQAASQRAAASARAGQQATAPTPLEIAARTAPRRTANEDVPTTADESAPAAIARAAALASAPAPTPAETLGPAQPVAAAAPRALAPAVAAQGRSQQQSPDARFAAAASPSGAAATGSPQLASAVAGQPRRLDQSPSAAAGTAVHPSRSPTATSIDMAGGKGTEGGGTIEVPNVSGGARSAAASSGANRAFDPQPAVAASTAGRRASGGLPAGALARGPVSDQGSANPTAPGQTGPSAATPGPAPSLASSVGVPRRRIEPSPAVGGSENGGSTDGQPLPRSTAGMADGLPDVEAAEVPLPGAAGPQPFAQSQSQAAEPGSASPPHAALQPSTGATGRSQPASSSGGGKLADNQLANAGAPHSQSSSGLPVRIAAPEGPGGLSHQPAAEPGLPTRRARPESDVVHSVASRIILEKSGGRPTIDARVRDTAVPAFKQRDAQDRQDVATSRGGTQGTERAVELGLDFLARHQSPDGSWSLHNFAAGRRGYERAGQGSMQSDSAGTGLALLAFLGAGYTHTDGKYRLVVSRGLDYLVRNQKPDGDLFSGGSQYCWLYSHGIASIALCEAYGMTRDQAVEGPAQRAIDFIAAAQNPDEGGWRYSPGRDSDTSVSGWQLMALKSGELSGLKIPPECYARMEKWLDGAASRGNPSRYVYRPKAEQAHQREASLAMTAESLLMRQYLGWKRDNANLVAGADFLRANLPQWGTRSVPRRDAYYWYYATQVMFQMQGKHWKDWNDSLRKLLVDSQVQSGPFSGSWDPVGPVVPDRWGAAGGRIYVTAMHLLMLEVYYRHLPLYQSLEE